MANKKLYYQCKMKHGSTYTTAYIPGAFADVGKHYIHTKDGKSDEWEVIAVFGSATPEEVRKISHNSEDIWVATSGDEPRGNK